MDELRKQYQALKDKLNYDTGHINSSSRAVKHPSYGAILAMGEPVVKFILDDFDRWLQTDEHAAFPGHLAFKILHTLTKVVGNPGDPPPGVVKKMVEGWVKWGEEKGILTKDRPKYVKPPPTVYKGWVVVGLKHGAESVLCRKTEPRNAFEETHGQAAWVTKIDAARKVDDGWWCCYAWIVETKREAEMIRGVLMERIKNGECSEFNKPTRTWVEYVERQHSK
jgi:hypothetical protein